MNKKRELINAGLAWAILLSACLPCVAQETSPAVPAAEAIPRTADGHPDLNGIWTSGGNGGAGLIVNVSPDGKQRDVYFRSLSPNPEDNRKLGRAQAQGRGRGQNTNAPSYKPEMLAKVKELAADPDHNDPSFVCKPTGVPRMGPPSQVVQMPGQVVFLYSNNYFRVVPTNGSPHRKDLDPSFMGDSVGHWEGDTLVVDVVGFNDETWLASGGYFHSEAMHVTERFTREGKSLHYQATVEDPDVLTKPWIMNPRTLKLGGPQDALVEDLPCRDLDEPHMPHSVN